METSSTTPLLDAYRAAQAPRSVRLMAAQGVLSRSAHEQLALLVLLIGDPDSDVSSTAEATLRRIPRDAIDSMLEGSEVPSEVRAFFGAAGGQGQASEEVPAATGDTGPEAEGAEADEAEDERSTSERLANMTVPERVARAMKGTRQERALLVRDPNKMVSAAVLSSPKLTDPEVESIARMANVSEEVLRVIASKRHWMKNYGTVAALVKNPKTPLALSMNLLGRLSDRDLRVLSTNRNVPDPLRVSARKRIIVS